MAVASPASSGESLADLARSLTTLMPGKGELVTLTVGRQTERMPQAELEAALADRLVLLTALREANVDVGPEELVREFVAALRAGRIAPPSPSLTEAELALFAADPEDHVPDSGPAPVVTTATKTATLIAQSLTIEEAAALLHQEVSAVHLAITERRLWTVRTRSGDERLPELQFDGGRPVPGLDRVMQALPIDMHPLARANWLTLPSVDLVADERVSPLTWLTTGGAIETVVRLATSLAGVD